MHTPSTHFLLLSIRLTYVRKKLDVPLIGVEQEKPRFLHK